MDRKCLEGSSRSDMQKGSKRFASSDSVHWLDGVKAGMLNT